MISPFSSFSLAISAFHRSIEMPILKPFKRRQLENILTTEFQIKQAYTLPVVWNIRMMPEIECQPLGLSPLEGIMPNRKILCRGRSGHLSLFLGAHLQKRQRKPRPLADNPTGMLLLLR